MFKTRIKTKLLSVAYPTKDGSPLLQRFPFTLCDKCAISNVFRLHQIKLITHYLPSLLRCCWLDSGKNTQQTNCFKTLVRWLMQAGYMYNYLVFYTVF